MYKNVCIRENVKRMCAMAQNTLRYAMQTCCMFCVCKYNTQHWEDTGKNIHDFQGESEEKSVQRKSERESGSHTMNILVWWWARETARQRL